MIEFLNSPMFGIVLCIITYEIGVLIQKKTKSMLANPLLIAIVLCVSILQIFHIPYEYFANGGSFISLFLAPATASLAVSIYSRFDILKANIIPVLTGCITGSLTSLISVYMLCNLFGLNDVMLYSLLPKSVTTPIAMDIASSLGGIPSVTVVAVIFTGILGAMIAPLMIKILHITNPVETGLAIGASSHAVGTSKAIELGEIEVAMSSIAITVCGLVTVLFSLVI